MKLIQRLALPASLESLDVSPSGKLSYTCEDSRRTLAATETQHLELPRAEDHFFYSSLASRDGETLYLTDANRHRLVAVRDDQEVWSVESQTVGGNLQPLEETPEGDVFFSGATFGALISPQGQPRWLLHSQHHQPHSGHCSLYAGGRAYLGGIDGLEELGGWFTASPRDHVISELASDGARLYASAFGRKDGLLVAYDARDGQELWRRQTGFNRAMRPVVQGDGSVVEVDQDGQVRCFDRDGRARWSHDLSEVTDLFSDPGREDGAPTSPALDQRGNLYVGRGSTLFCWEGQTGRLRGKLQLPSQLAPCQSPQVAPDGTLYVHDGQQGILMINAPELLEIPESGTATIKVESDQVTIGSIRLPVRRKA